MEKIPKNEFPTYLSTVLQIFSLKNKPFYDSPNFMGLSLIFHSLCPSQKIILDISYQTEALSTNNCL